MINARFSVPEPYNEPVLGYAPGSSERATLKAKLAEMSAGGLDIPLFIGGKEVRTGKKGEVRSPHDHGRLLARYHMGGAKETKAAIDAALKARRDWANTPWEERAAIFLRAAELLAGPYRQVLNAATVLGQSKNAYQAEIDSACELIDFWRYNVRFCEQIYGLQPSSSKGQWNLVDYRPLEGFVFAVTPFNFTAIAGNLPTAPAMLGNTVVWKPAATAMLNAHFILEILRKAGLPDGVINMVAGPASEISSVVLNHPELAGVHFTGSTPVFQSMWTQVGQNIARYRSYPRLVGETGGKDFVLLHPSGDLDEAATALTRGAFEYQGQKCSAASRAYVPDTRWPALKKKMGENLARIKMGPPEDFENFVNAVIDKKAYDSIMGYVQQVKPKNGAKILFGGKGSDERGYFIEPTVIQASAPDYRTLCEEIFGPVLTVYVYPEKKFGETLKIVDKTSPYALTGAVLARDRGAIAQARTALANSAGNFYINDKPTGAVVGQQPFGGARASGTNDKAGSLLNLIRWVSPRTIKENLLPPTDFSYPSFAKDSAKESAAAK
ncbi:MAG TPA: L-glutamate gamma-semialdehyde dehydrogenase [Elusimicrobiota bacterium]|jgi:1-pyrroline-5-carboxylate dehydrogenase|nr:L-glutamate gamma-semialdehyde dehydrogenase [Elusimicrobiota bacterium]